MAEQLDVPSLKVAELKTELTKRGLPTKGLKAELAARLTEAIAESNAEDAPPETTGADTPTEDGKPEQPVGDNHQDNTTEKDVKESQEAQNNSEVDSQSTQTKEQADSSTQRSSEAANTGKETPNDQTENADLAKVQAEATGTRDDRVEPSEQQVQLEESQERKRKREDPVQESTAEPDRSIPDQKEANEGTASPSPQPDTKKRRTSAPPPINASRPVDASAPPPSECIYVANLTRPLQEADWKDKLEQYGPVERLWLAKIRSHSYVQFNSVDSAKKAQQDLNGAKFPPATGKILTVFHLPLKAMDDLLKEEDAAMVRRQGRMDVNVSFQQGQWSYTLVPFGTAQQPVPAAAQSDQLSIRGLASAVPMQMRPLNEPPPSAHPRGLEDQPGRAPLPPPGRHGGRQNPLPISLRAGDSFRTRGPPPRRSPPPSRSLPSGAKLTKYGPPIAYKPYKSL